MTRPGGDLGAPGCPDLDLAERDLAERDLALLDLDVIDDRVESSDDLVIFVADDTAEAIRGEVESQLRLSRACFQNRFD